MRDLRGFREAVRVHRRAVGHTQRQLAKSIGLHPDVLSHKLNGSDNAMLTTQDVIGIATTLAGWGALATRTDVYALLDLAGVPRHAIPAAAWSAPPLTVLRDIRDDVTASRTISAPASGIPEGPAVSPGQPAAPRPRVTPTPLPASATQLIGRERERAEVAAAVELPGWSPSPVSAGPARRGWLCRRPTIWPGTSPTAWPSSTWPRSVIRR